MAVTFAHNIPGGKHGAQADFDRVRAHAKAAYNTLRLSASSGRVLADDWQWRALVNAPVTPDALVPGEQFGAGGATSVRGFAEREVSNDSGVNLNLELYTPNWCGQALGYQCRALGFYDTAWHAATKCCPAKARRKASAAAAWACVCC